MIGQDRVSRSAASTLRVCMTSKQRNTLLFSQTLSKYSVINFLAVQYYMIDFFPLIFKWEIYESQVDPFHYDKSHFKLK